MLGGIYISFSVYFVYARAATRASPAIDEDEGGIAGSGGGEQGHSDRIEGARADYEEALSATVAIIA